MKRTGPKNIPKGKTLDTERLRLGRLRLIFFVLGPVIGLFYVFVLPPLQAPDEFEHFYRAYGVSGGSCIAPPMLEVPQTLTEFAATFPPHVERLGRIKAGDLVALARTSLNESRRVPVANETINLYSCVPYLPSALAIRVGRMFDASPLVLLYLGRLANLMVYLAIVWLSLRELPGFQLPLLAVALMPMAIHQAASASWDGIAFASAFFLFAYVLKLACSDSVSKVEWKHKAVLAAPVIMAGLCRTNAWLAGLIFLIPSTKYRSGRERWLTAVGFLLMAFTTTAVWNYIDRQNFIPFDAARTQGQIYVADNIRLLYQRPGLFLSTLERSIRFSWRYFLVSFVGTLGWLAVSLPTWIVASYLAMLALIAQTSGIRVSGFQRLMLGVVWVAFALSVAMALWSTEIPRPYLESQILNGSGNVPGLQGRYLIPVALPFLLAISTTMLRIKNSLLVTLVIVMVVLANGVALHAIADRYYASANSATSGIWPIGNRPQDAILPHTESATS